MQYVPLVADVSPSKQASESGSISFLLEHLCRPKLSEKPANGLVTRRQLRRVSEIPASIRE